MKQLSLFLPCWDIASLVSKGTIRAKEYLKTKLMELSTIRQQIENILKDVNKIEENTGIGIQQKKAGNLHISTNEVLFKEVWSKALEYYHKKEYIKAIKLYDKAIVIDPDSALAWDFKGDALDKLGKHDEPAKCHQKPIEIDPNLGVTLA